MKKMILLMLTLFFLGSANVNAQVRIGGEGNPNPAAVLDLNAADGSVNGKLGAALPRVTLIDVREPLEVGKTPEKGTMVYNAAGLIPQGIYVWDGKWNAVRGSSSTIVGPDIPTVDGSGCDGSIIYFGAFDYADGTPGDIAKTVTNATNTTDHSSLPYANVLNEIDFVSAGALCVYKKDGTAAGTSTWADAVNNCANGSYADGDGSVDWYLPNTRELKAISEVLQLGTGLSFYALNGFNGVEVVYTSPMNNSSIYWSSQDGLLNSPGRVAMRDGAPGYDVTVKKTDAAGVRCVKRL
jgi:hypothetical protein